MMKRKLLLKVQHGDLKPGVYTFGSKLGDYLIKTNKAEPVQATGSQKFYKPVVKQEKRVIENKQEKFEPETKMPVEEFGTPERDFALVPISKLDVSTMTNAELQRIIDGDERVTAVRMAKKELDARV